VRFDILTLFPDAVEGWLRFSIVKRAQEKGIARAVVTDIRRFTLDRHRTADEPPYGGGQGMLMRPEPVVAAVEWAIAQRSSIPEASSAAEASTHPKVDDQPEANIVGSAVPESVRVILLSPIGKRLDQAMLEELATADQLVLLCGRYEGMDERVRLLVVTDEISLGDFVLTGGELAAAVVVDGVTRLLPGVLGKDESAIDESFTSGLLEYPQYTRPPEFRGEKAPAVLLKGHHGEVKLWRDRQAMLRTLALRPDLLPEDWRDRLSPPPKKRRKRKPRSE
jgi:tRNA (guanine37-N1)-methyltransferase